MVARKPDLAAAYALQTPQDSVDLYRKWAMTYDEDFAKANDYRNPQLIAELFASCADRDVPVLDVGAGTGLVGEALSVYGISPVDGLDISAEMLEVAMSKGCYRNTIHTDLTGSIAVGSDTYRGIISVGTFTHGHVGPEAIDELLRVASSGALFALGINAKVFEPAGFAAKFTALKNSIRDFQLVETQGYGGNANAELQKGRSTVALFRKK